MITSKAAPSRNARKSERTARFDGYQQERQDFQQWMQFMKAEFERLDTTKKGEINPNDLLHSIVSAGRVRTSDLGK
jgi:hypothetical protein